MLHCSAQLAAISMLYVRPSSWKFELNVCAQQSSVCLGIKTEVFLRYIRKGTACKTSALDVECSAMGKFIFDDFHKVCITTVNNLETYINYCVTIFFSWTTMACITYFRRNIPTNGLGSIVGSLSYFHCLTHVGFCCSSSVCTCCDTI